MCTAHTEPIECHGLVTQGITGEGCLPYNQVTDEKEEGSYQYHQPRKTSTLKIYSTVSTQYI